MIYAYPNLRVVLMSATIDTSMFSEYFNNCPIVEIEGRSFPVQGKPAMIKQMNEWMNKWTNEWKNQWINEPVNE